MSNSSSRGRTDKKPPKGMAPMDSAKVDASSAPSVRIQLDEPSSGPAPTTMKPVAPKAPADIDSAAEYQANEDIHSAARDLAQISSFPLSQILMLIGGVALSACAIVSLLVIWSMSSRSKELVQQIVEESSKGNAAVSEQLNSLPNQLSESLGKQYPDINQSLNQSEAAAKHLADVVFLANEQIKSLGDQTQRDMVYKEAVDLLGKVDQLRTDMSLVTQNLRELSYNMRPVSMATLIACGDNSARLAFDRYQQPLKTSLRSVLALMPQSQFAVYRIGNGAVVEPPVLGFGSMDWKATGNSAGANLSENLRDVDSLPFPQNVERRRVIALVSEDAEPPPKPSKVELNAVLIQFIVASPGGDSQITPTLSVSKLERWIAHCRDSGGRLVYLPLPISADVEKNKTLVELNAHLISSTVRELLLDWRAPTATVLRDIGTGANPAQGNQKAQPTAPPK